MNKRLSNLNRHSNAEMEIRVQSEPACRGRMNIIFVLFMLLLIQTVSAQEVARTDSVTVNKHSPRKATIYSMVLPGLGQAYNKKYWKIPVIYAGFGTLIYFINTNNKRYLQFKQAYQWNIHQATDSTPINNPLIHRYPRAADLLTGMNYYRRNLEVSVMLTAVLYILNIVDASVDANFFTFNVSEELTLHVEPYVSPSPFATKQNGGLRLTLSF